MLVEQFHGRSLACRLRTLGLLLHGERRPTVYRVAHYNHEHLRHGATVDKAIVKKNLGQLMRESQRDSSHDCVVLTVFYRSLLEG